MPAGRFAQMAVKRPGYTPGRGTHMYARYVVVLSSLIAGLLVAPLAAVAEPALEQLRFDPPQLCLRDTFRWGFLVSRSARRPRPP